MICLLRAACFLGGSPGARIMKHVTRREGLRGEDPRGTLTQYP